MSKHICDLCHSEGGEKSPATPDDLPDVLIRKAWESAKKKDRGTGMPRPVVSAYRRLCETIRTIRLAAVDLAEDTDWDEAQNREMRGQLKTSLTRNLPKKCSTCIARIAIPKNFNPHAYADYD